MTRHIRLAQVAIVLCTLIASQVANYLWGTGAGLVTAVAVVAVWYAVIRVAARRRLRGCRAAA